MNFSTVVMDPPWNERGGGKVKRGADRHYALLQSSDMPDVIRSCPQWSQLDENTHLYMWVTNSYLKDGLWLMEELGFRYITNIAWAKQRIGIGRYFRGQHELCLFGVRGNGFRNRTADNSIPSLITAPRTKHSKKPESFMELVERRSVGPYLEMFARNSRPGWTSWGNEVPVEEEDESGT